MGDKLLKSLNITIFVTMQCNLRCTYCYEKNEDRVGTISFEMIDNVIEFVERKIKTVGAKKLNIRFHGGEPLIAFDKIEYIVEKLNARCCELVGTILYTMTTNFTLYNSAMSSLLKDFSSISVSVDGTELSHNRNRKYIDGTGTYLDVKNNVGRAILDGLNIIGRLTLTKENYENVDVNVKSIIDMGIGVVDIELDLEEKDWMSINIDLYIEKLKSLIDYCNFLKYTQSRDVRIPIFTQAVNKPKNTLCDGGISSFVIVPDGSVYPCILAVNNSKYRIGDIDGNVNEKVLRFLHEVGEQHVETCEGCARYDYCSTTRCKLINEIYTGSYYKAVQSVCLTENINVRIGNLYRQLSH